MHVKIGLFDKLSLHNADTKLLNTALDWPHWNALIYVDVCLSANQERLFASKTSLFG